MDMAFKQNKKIGTVWSTFELKSYSTLHIHISVGLLPFVYGFVDVIIVNEGYHIKISWLEET